jgi:hypothetical protein
MTTDVQAAQSFYDQLKPQARRAARDYVLARTPAYLQEEMVTVFEADMQGMTDEVAPPTVIDAPLIYQTGTGVGSTLTSTLGNWYGSPNSRTYQWKRGVTNVGTSSPNYTVAAPDIGQNFTCVMTATNVSGTSAPVTSNAIVVA